MAGNETAGVEPPPFLGNYDPETRLYHVANEFALAAERIIDNLVAPDFGSRKTRNGWAYNTMQQAQVLRLSDFERKPLRSGLAREITDNVAILFANPYTTAPYNRLAIERVVEEYRARKGFSRVKQPVLTAIRVAQGIKDPWDTVAVQVSHEEEAAELTMYPQTTSEFKLSLTPAEDDINVGDIEPLLPPVVNDISTVLMMAETVSERKLTTDFKEGLQLLDEEDYADGLDPHLRTPGFISCAVDKLLTATVARPQD